MINQMLSINYVIIKLSERKTTKGEFTCYVITGGRGVFKMIIHDYGGGGEGMALWWNKKVSFLTKWNNFQTINWCFIKAYMFFISYWGRHNQKWVRLLLSHGALNLLYYKNEWLDWDDFLYADANSGKFKIALIILGWLCSKMGMGL